MSLIHSLFQIPYDVLLRPYLPRKIGVYNSVAVREPALLDATDYYPKKKTGLINGISMHISEDDTVLEIGTGRGVATVCCARRCKKIISYEASERMYATATETIKLNGVADTVDLYMGLVGSDVDVWGPHDDAPTIAPSDLPSADMLVTDCEGAEMSILTGLDELPAKLVVEAHDCFGVPTDDVIDFLETRGYIIDSIELHTPNATREANVVTAHHP